MNPNSKFLYFVFATLLTSCAADIQQKANPLEAFDSVVESAMKSFQVPGASIAVVQGGKTQIARGYGFRDVENKLPADEDTLFALGSTTKAMTATLLGVLADQSKLSFDDTVIKHMPQFRLADPKATQEVTLNHLLSHQSGLPRHDLAWYGTGYSQTELFLKLPNLELTAQPGEQWQYQNLMFMIAGMAAEKVAGGNRNWSTLMRDYVFSPLGMGRTNTSVTTSTATVNHALPYVYRQNKWTEIPFYNADAIAAAGGVNSTARDMTKWLRVNLESGKLDEITLLSEGTLQAIHSQKIEHEILATPERELVVNGYAYGWMTADYRGFDCLLHSGRIDGFDTLVALFPEQNVGVYISINRNTPLFTRYLAMMVFDRMLGLSRTDWMTALTARYEESAKEKKPTPPQIKTLDLPKSTYLGEFSHPGYGPLSIVEDAETGNLMLTRFNVINAELRYVGNHRFWVVGGEAITGTDHMFIKFDVNEQTVQSVNVPIEPSLDPLQFIRTAQPSTRAPSSSERPSNWIPLDGIE